MTRNPIKTTPDVILLRVVERLKAQIADAKESNTYISTVSQELPPNPADVMFEVSLSHNFAFDPGELAGGGSNTIHTHASVMVTIHTQIQLDEMGRDLHYLTHASLGVCKNMTRVLAALTDHDLLNAAAQPILAHTMMPAQGQIPPKDERKKGFVTLIFDVDFDWDIS